MDKFEELLKELGKILDMPLHVDSEHSCTILVNEKLRVQMELERNQERLIVASFIGLVPPGKFRENVFALALKINNPYPRIGTFGYSAYSNQLMLFEYLHPTKLNGEKLADFLSVFIPKAMEWRDALEVGNIARLTTPTSETAKLPNPFGMVR